MNKNNLGILIIVFSVIISGAIIGSALAQAQQDPFDSIQYPVKELGNCQDKNACKTYCDDSKNIDACLAFAEKNNLMSAKELEMAKNFKKAGMVGPGGCDGKDACDKYCSESSHMEECISFAQENGLMSGKELEESQKVLAAIKKGVKPPACSGQKECDAYCSSSDHMEECMTFSIEAGLMPAEKQAEAQKMLAAIKQGIKPPACKGEEECRNYCSQDVHIEECVKFGEATGMMNKEDANMMRKTGGKGPGGCKSKEECENFCNTPENQETCTKFSIENGMMSQEDLQKMEQGKEQMKQTFTNMPPQVSECLSSAFGVEMAEKIKSGAIMPSQQIGEKMKTCFESFKPEPPQGEQNMQPGQEQGNFGPAQVKGGPGGCQSPEECSAYCAAHQEECQKFQSLPMQPGTQNMQNMQPGTQGLEGQQIEKQYQQQMETQGIQGQQMMGPQDQQIKQYQQQIEQQMMQGVQQIMQGLPPEVMQPGSAPGSVPGMAPQTQPGQFIQIQQQEGQSQQQPMMQQKEMIIQGGQAPSAGQMQQQPMQPGPGSNVPPPPTVEPAPQTEPAPTTLNSNSLLGSLIKPFVKIFGL